MKNLQLTVKVTVIAVVVIINGFACADDDTEDDIIPVEVKCLLDSDLHQTTCLESCDYCGCNGEFLQDGLRCVCICDGVLFDSNCLEDIQRANEPIGLNYTIAAPGTHGNVRMLRQAEDCAPNRRRFRDREERRNNRRQNRRDRPRPRPRFNGERRRRFRTTEPQPEPTRSQEDKFKPKESRSSYYRD